MVGQQSLTAFSFGIAFLWCCGAVDPLWAQTSGSPAREIETISGTVVNSLTHEPIGRALVSSPDNRYATMTDDRGRFEFKFPRAEGEQTPGSAGRFSIQFSGPSRLQSSRANRPISLSARKPGFLSENYEQHAVQNSGTEQELTIRLAPEALIVGHVVLSGSDGYDGIQVELYRCQVREGREHWDPAGTATSRADGEFRFAELPAGSYKLVTRELLDRDPLTFNPRGQLFGYPPVYYPAAKDFATASVIQLSEGSTFQANVSPARREYYAVRVGVANAPAGGVPLAIEVWPQGGAGPGYSLGYNAGEQLIQGSLPDGSYVIQAKTYGPNAMTGMLNLTVRGAAAEGSALMLLPNSSITVSVREEFQHRDAAAQGLMSTGDGNAYVARSGRRPGYLQVNLIPVGEFGFTPAASLRPTGPEDDSLLIENVQPGSYRVQVSTPIGFASSITSGGKDLQRHPLVVALGGATPPIEITVRDDGAEVEGEVEGPTPLSGHTAEFNTPGQSQGNVYFVPLADSGGQFRQTWVSPDGKFQLQQLPPGAYRVLAFDRQQPDLEYASDEAMEKYESKAQVIHVVAGQKEHLRLPLLTAGE